MWQMPSYLLLMPVSNLWWISTACLIHHSLLTGRGAGAFQQKRMGKVCNRICSHGSHLAGDAQLAPVAGSQRWGVQRLQPVVLQAALALLPLHSISHCSASGASTSPGVNKLCTHEHLCRHISGREATDVET